MQKTAYEMRISDWSSDVCSSDLLDHAFRGVALALRARGDGSAVEHRVDAVVGDRPADRFRLADVADHRGAAPGQCVAGAPRHRLQVVADRKRVVKGKGVSVRVSLGGRRTYKTKIKKTTTNK